ncbi:DsbA family protein [Pseudomonas chlororaphis]|uniref:DsbA family protein n=1 Tax=Pseudomonas chlororaphis TaxID=587753 RepID=UPI000472A489|nr:thioredoxin domain-containing protein [Pseudomonas chlororaphis]
MSLVPFYRGRRHNLVLASVLAGLLFSVAIGAYWVSSERRTATPSTSEQTAVVIASGPPWALGPETARFTLVAYADFECPYCQSYLPHLMRWVGETQDVALQWHHLPLPGHEPAASQAAQLAECFGEEGGAAAFWQAVTWVYEHTRGDGQGVPQDTTPAGMTPAVQACLVSERPAAIVRAQAEQAASAGIHATPTVQVQDRDTGQVLTLSGPAEDDVLLSALDWLASQERHTEQPEMPADELGDMPK